MQLRTTVITLLLMLVLALGAFGQTSTPEPVPDPSMFLTVGAAGSQYSDPHFGITGAFGKRIAAGTYFTTAIDMTTRLDLASGKRVAMTTLRPGVQKVIARSGPLTVSISGDVGGTAGDGSLVGQLSGGGAVAYDLPRHPNLFVYGALRIIKSPQPDPALANPAIVQTAFAFGIGLKLP